MATPPSSQDSKALAGIICGASNLQVHDAVPPCLSLTTLSFCLLILTFLASCSKPLPPLPSVTKDGTPVVAMVGTEHITMASLQVVAAQNGYNLQNEQDRGLAIRDAVNNEIIAAEAKKLGYEDDPDIRRYVKSQTVQKLLLATVDKEHQGPVPTEGELKAFYDANIKDFTPPTLAKAQILGLLKRQGQDPQFGQKLEAVKSAIATREVPFSDLVKQFSDDPAAQVDAGVTNWLVRGEVNKQYPEAILKALFEVEDANEITGPIEHNDWVYFVKQVELRNSGATGFDQVKSQIGQQMMRKKRLDAYNTFVERLKGGVQVQTFPEKVAAEVQATTQQSGPPMGPVRTQ